MAFFRDLSFSYPIHNEINQYGLAQYGNAKHEHAEKLIIQEMRHGVMAYAIVFNDCEKETKGKQKNFKQNGCNSIVET